MKTILLSSLAVFTAAGASAGTIDFESIPDLENVTTQYSSKGITFGNATALTAGISLNEFDFPPRSGTNVIVDSGGPLVGSFDAPVEFVEAFLTYTLPVTFSVFDVKGNLLASLISQYTDNLQTGSNPSNEKFYLASNVGIGSFSFAGGAFGNSFALDDLRFEEKDKQSVPEGASFWTLLAVPAVLLLKRRSLQTQVALEGIQIR
ncbi:MAG: hypothetical protein SFV32_03710 [Opitutaceae bacterium]|nr:hypothetical protein [Opitutaceae bacterium]